MVPAKAFITGGTGFFGGVLLRRLLDAGYRVRALARRPDALAAEPGLEVVGGDLSDPGRLAEQIQGFDLVFHTAALVATWRRDPGEFYRTNVQGFQNVLGAARKAGVRTLVYTSTFFALGPAESPGAAEDSGLHSPRWHPYQHSKALARVQARQALAAGEPIVILYPGVIYGPGRQTEGNLVGKLIEDFQKGKVPGLIGGGTQVWSYSFVDDVVEGHLRAAGKYPEGGEYVLGGENVSLSGFFRILARLTGESPPRLKIPVWAGVAVGGVELMMARLTGRPPQLIPSTARMICRSWACDSRKAARDLGYSYRTLEQGLRKTLGQSLRS